MKKLVERNKKIRKEIKKLEKKKMILKSIYNNFYFKTLIRANAINLLGQLPQKSSKTLISNKCIVTNNKNKFNKLTNFSRIIFHKIAKNKKMFGIYKSSR